VANGRAPDRLRAATQAIRQYAGVHRNELRDLGVKAVHLALRQAAIAPEQMAARRLSRSMPAVPPATGPLILIMSMRDWAVHVQLEALLGHALQLRGARVAHLTCGGNLEICDRVNTWEGPPMPCRSCTKYVHDSLAAHGRTANPLSSFGFATGWPELDAMSLEELREVTYRELPLGRIVEIPTKWFLLADALSEDPLGAPTYRSFLRSSRAIVDRASGALDAIRPDQVVMLNGLFLFEALVWELCKQRSIPVVTYERGFILNSFVFARDAPAGLTELDHVWPSWVNRDLTPDEADALDDYLEDRLWGRRTADQYWRDVTFDVEQRPRTGTRALLLTNLVWDSAVIGRDRAFSSIVEWITSTIRLFEARRDDELTIRVHPAELKLPGRESRQSMESSIRKRIPALPPNIRIVSADNPVSSYSLMESSDVGLVYSSTAGLEMALRGKPVVVAAHTHYSGKGFTIDACSASDYERSVNQLLDHPSDIAVDVSLARKYAYLFFFRFPYVGLGVEEHVRGLVRLTATASEHLRPGASAMLDALCRQILEHGGFWPQDEEAVPVA
jgi:hypothetical protein